jgi:plastocyanin
LRLDDRSPGGGAIPPAAGVRRRIEACALALSLALAVGCGGSGAAEGPLPPGRTGAVADPHPHSGGIDAETAAKSIDGPTFSVAGRAIFDGPRPEPRSLVTAISGADPKCHHRDERGDPLPVFAEDEIVSEEGGVRNVLVYVSGGPTPKLPRDRAAPPSLVDQSGCRYRPHVLGVVAGASVVFRNSDSTIHNVNMISERNGRFNWGQPGPIERPWKFETPESAIRVSCDVHPWMKMFVHVLDLPYFAVTDADGRFRIEGLPPGDYELTAWHEVYGEKRIGVSIAGADRTEANFRFSRP